MLDSVARFILEYIPNQEESQLIQGYQNRIALPQTQSYIVFAYSGTVRHGTNINRYSDTEDELYIHALREYSVDIDVCDIDQLRANDKASTLEIVGRSNIGAKFFKTLGLCLEYTDNIQYLPFTDETEQYIHRYRVTIHLTKWEKATVNQQYAEYVELQRVENIDAHHNLKGGNK